MERKFVLSCCSTVDLPYAYMAQRDIPVLFYHYVVGDQEYVDDMGRDPAALPRFYGFLKAGQLPQTSQINVADYLDFFEEQLQKGDLLHIAFTSGQSGSVHNAQAAGKLLQEKYPGAQLYMTIGSDMLETFDEWYRWREILAMVTLVVQSREPGDGDALHAAAQKLEEAGGKIMFADAPVLECASSDIRAGKYPPARLKELLPPPVADVIHRNGLYGKLI